MSRYFSFFFLNNCTFELQLYAHIPLGPKFFLKSFSLDFLAASASLYPLRRKFPSLSITLNLSCFDLPPEPEKEINNLVYCTVIKLYRDVIPHSDVELRRVRYSCTQH